MKRILYLFALLLVSCFSFGQSHQFAVSNNNYKIVNLINEVNKQEQYLLLNTTHKGFDFEILDNNLSLISKGSYDENSSYPFQVFYKSFKLLGDKLSVTKIYSNPNTYSYPFEATFIFDVKTGNFNQMIFQNEKELLISPNRHDFRAINKGQNGTNLSEVVSASSNGKLYFVVESLTLPKVTLVSKIRESTIKVLNSDGKELWSLYKNYKESDKYNYHSLLHVKDNKVFVIENNFESKRKFLGSVLKIYNIEDGNLIGSLEINKELGQYLEITKIEDLDDKTILIGMYKNPSKNFSELEDKAYAGVFKWVIDDKANTISKNLFGWLRINPKINNFINTDEVKKSYLKPLRNFETKKGYSILFKNELDDFYSFETRNYFLINFDSNNEIISSKKYFKNETALIDYKYSAIDRKLSLIELDNLNKKNKNLKLSDSDFGFQSKIIKMESNDYETNSINAENKILLIKKNKEGIILNLHSIN